MISVERAILTADNRSVSSGAWKLSLPLGVDMVANLVRESAPELDGLTSGNRRP
jgi:hypothetical protein